MMAPADSHGLSTSSCPSLLMHRVSTKARILSRHAKCFRIASTRGMASAVPQESDVVIVGGGPAGLALASALSTSTLPSAVHLGNRGPRFRVRDTGDTAGSACGGRRLEQGPQLERRPKHVLESRQFDHQRVTVVPGRCVDLCYVRQCEGVQGNGQEIGAWAHVEDGRTCPIEEMQVRVSDFSSC